jgi:hypothetical protein
LGFDANVIAALSGTHGQKAVKAGLVDFPEKFPYCFTCLTKQEKQG